MYRRGMFPTDRSVRVKKATWSKEREAKRRKKNHTGNLNHQHMFVHCFLRFSVLPAVNNDNCVSTLLLPLLHLPDKIHNPNSRVRKSRVWPINVLELCHCARFLKLNTNQSINQSLNLSVSQSFRPSVSRSVSQSVSQAVNQSINQSIKIKPTEPPQTTIDNRNDD